MPSAIEELTQALEAVNRTILKLAQGAVRHGEGTTTPETKAPAAAPAPVEDKQNPEDLRDKARTLLKAIADKAGTMTVAREFMTEVTGAKKLPEVEDADIPNLIAAAEKHLAEKQAA